ncbi:MAG: EAL domain-containing protein [Chromatiales bacterium]|nr:MAG: EAL domain-containing protein [Chromatiales bacterium]
MTKTREKDQVLADYTAFLTALLPQTQGFLCHDRHGRPFWFDQQPIFDAVGGDAGFRKALQQVLDSAADAPHQLVRVERHNAYILSLADGAGTHQGALTVVAPTREGIPLDFVVDALQPALRTLRRELSLRVKLMGAQRKLTVQAAEEKLLHHVESVVCRPQESAKTLGDILELCRTYLSVAEAGMSVPDKQFRLLSSDGRDAGEPGERVDELIAQGLGKTGGDCVVVPIAEGAGQSAGQLVLAGWGQSAFSGRRRRRLARYVASQIDAVVARDFDPLTGLPGWPVFEALLVAESQKSPRRWPVLMYLDVDQLHVINQNYGRAVGDEVLCNFANVLQDRLQDLPMSRISSDSFAALVPSTDRESILGLAEGICKHFNSLRFRGGNKSFHASVSIGIAPLEGGEDGSSNLSAAQVACRAAKDRGAGRVEIYEPADQSIVRRMDDIQLVGHVREAIDQERLLLLGQPIRSLKSDEPFQYQEVLVRMLDKQGRLVEPREFISAAERYQLMKELDRWVVSSSLRSLRDSGMTQASDPVRMAINLSGQSLGDERFLVFVREQIEATGVAPELICFEITETVAVANLQRAQAFMHALKGMGCRFSLDDFGTGLSSFAYLKLFPVDTLKIDGSFVRDLADNKVSQSVVAAISEVARVMELETVAEFVQDDNSLELLRDLGVHWGQGYLLGEPAPLAEQLGQPDVVPAASRTSSFSR